MAADRALIVDRRTFLGGTVFGGAALALAGCAAAAPRIRPADPDFGRNATGTVEVWCRSATQSGLTATVARFNRSSTRLKVNLTPIPDGQYVTKLATSIRGGSPPDVVDIDDINSQLFIFREAFADLTVPAKRLGYFDDLSPGHLHLLERKNRYYGLPYAADNSMLYLNTELFDRAGVDTVESTKDFDTLIDAATRIRKLGDDTYGWTFPGNSPGALGFVVLPHIWATGEDLQKGEIGSQSGHIADNEPLRRTLEFYRQLWTDKLAPPASYTDNASAWGSDFRRGEIGIFPTSYGAVWPASTPAFRKKMTNVLIPGPDGKRSFFDGGDTMCIPNGAANPDGGWAFMTYATSLSQQQLLPEGGYFPIRSDAATPAYKKKFPLAALALENIDRGYAPQTLPYNLLYNQAAGPWLTMFRRAVFGDGVTPALKAAQVSWDRILDQAQA